MRRTNGQSHRVQRRADERTPPPAGLGCTASSCCACVFAAIVPPIPCCYTAPQISPSELSATSQPLRGALFPHSVRFARCRRAARTRLCLICHFRPGFGFSSATLLRPITTRRSERPWLLSMTALRQSSLLCSLFGLDPQANRQNRVAMRSAHQEADGRDSLRASSSTNPLSLPHAVSAQSPRVSACPRRWKNRICASLRSVSSTG